MNSPIPSAALNSCCIRVCLHIVVTIARPRHWKFNFAGIAREFKRQPESKLGRLLAVSHDQRKPHRPRA